MLDHASRRHIALHVLVIVALLVGALGDALPISAAPLIEAQLPIGNLPAVANPDRATPPDQPAAPTGSGPSMFLNGASYVSIPDASLPAIGGNDMALEAWIYPGDLSGFRAVFAKQYNVGFWFGLYNGKLRFYRGSTAYVESAATIPINRWTHIAVNSYYDYYEGQYMAEFYINGDFENYYFHTGAGAVGGTYPLTIGSDQGVERFWGDIAEARLWSGLLSGETLRRNMHHAINEKRPGLIANWHFTGDFKDAINGIDGTPVGSPAFVGFPSPAQPDVSPTDRFFNTLPQATYAAGTAFVPRLNRAILAGGYRAGVPSTAITSVDAGSGAATNIGNLPLPRAYPAAAYATSNDTVYVFGGSDQLATTNSFDSIYAVNPETGASRTVAATLPAGRDNATAVYLDHLNKIAILGGWYYDAGVEKYADSIYIFDVATESITAAPFTLLQPGYGLAAAYSPLTQKAYFFGGSPDGGATFDDKAYALTLNADDTGSIETLAVKLPKADRGGMAVEDPINHLIYIIDGQFNERVIAFDPTSNELWQTPIELPRDDAGNLLIRPYASVIYAPRQRHALVIGGDYWNQAGKNNVWRIPLGDGPSVPFGRWDFVNSFVGNLDYMSSVYWRIAMGRASGFVQYYNSDKSVTYPGARTGTGLRNLTLDPSDGTTWFSLYDTYWRGIQRDNGGISTIYSEPRAAPVTYGYQPGAVMPYQGVPFFGNGGNLTWRTFADIINGTWKTSFGGDGSNYWQWTQIPAIAHRSNSEAWAVVEPWYYAIGAPGNAPQAGPTPTRPKLGRLIYNFYGGAYSETLIDPPCSGNIWAKDLVFGLNGDWWVGGAGGLCRYAKAFPPTNPANFGQWFTQTVGSNVMKLSVDGDGRIWAALMPDTSGNTGGLSAYEVLSTTSVLGTVRKQDWNWLTAPIGTLTSVANGWNSGIRALTANGERVWMALNTDPLNGPLAMYSPRWQQLSGFNQGSMWGVRKVFLARGRAFFATNSDHLVALQPDGISWDDRALAGVNAVTADQQGRIWIGSSDGVRRWTSSGWDMIDGAVGDPPVGPINSIAVDSKNRVWIGGENGLTLFDRERWVTTIQPPQGAISVTAVLVDHDDNVWVGTTQGLGKLDTTDQTWTTYTTADNLYTDHIFDIAQLGDGQIAVSTSDTGGGLSLFNGTTFVKQTYPPGKDQALSADQNGRLWAGAILREPTGYYGRFWTNSGLIDSTVIDNASDGANLMWFTHPSGGVSIRSAYLPVLADIQPQILPQNGIVPNRGKQGDIITINGSGFGDSRSDVEVTIGGATTIISSVTDSQIMVQLGGNNVSGGVTVRRGKQTVTVGSDSAPAFCAVPRITNVTPTGGNVGVEVKITGSNFDVGATVQLGNGTAKTLGVKGAGTGSTWIDYNDTNGSVVVSNKCANATTTVSNFRKFNLSISQIVLNQGMAAYGLMSARPTLVSAFFVRDQALRSTDVIKADRVEVFVNPVGGPADGYPDVLNVYTRTIPTALGSTPAAQLYDLVNSLNVPNVYAAAGSSTINVRLLAAGKVVAQGSVTRDFGPNYPLNVLLIPIMPNGYTSQDLNTLKTNVAKGWGDLRTRLLPNGRGVFDWSDEVLTSGPISIGSEYQLFDISHQFDRIRARRNRSGGTQYTVAFGVIAESLKAPGTSTFGYGFWPDVSDFFNRILLTKIDTLCDLGNTALQIISLGFLGSDDGCHLTIPLYVGWATDTKFGRTDSSALIGHELGHILNLVKPWAPNGSFSENLSHSINDELDGGNCNDNGVTYNQNRTLYRQPGVSEPVVNPITGEQFYSQLSKTTSGTPADKNTNRGKAIMAYGCKQTNSNVFFEPADVAAVKADLYGAIRPLLDFVLPKVPQTRQAVQTISGPTPRVVPGERLNVSGLITQTVDAATGEIRRVEALGQDAPLSVPVDGGYWLVQRTASGTEVQRDGVYVMFAAAESDAQRPATGEQLGFFTATMLRADGVAQIDLEHNGVVLASFTAGSSAPIVSISSPTGGTFNSGTVPIEWSTRDGDNDPLEISIEYSRDDGATWTPIGSAQAGGPQSLNMPVAQLGGSNSARVRVTASDGFTYTIATSGPFSVTAQPPQPHIMQPETGSTALEGETTLLSGGADDLQDGYITATQQLRWFSNLDGALGKGAALPVVLSVGTHVITLEAENSAGLTATTEITLTVAGDYDGDTIPDTVEAADGLNPLTANDALSDLDGDGLPLVMELHYGTDPNNPDTDGDGRTDDEEIVAQTDPAVNDTPAPDQLQVSPEALTMTVDLAQDTVLPQDFVQVFSRDARPFTATVDAAWLSLSAITGTTPAQLTVVINPIGLAEGTQTGSITVISDLGSVTVPVTVAASNKADFCDANRDGMANQQDVTAVQARVGAVMGDANYAVQYDVNRDSIIDAADVAQISTCVVTYGDVKVVYLPLVRK